MKIDCILDGELHKIEISKTDTLADVLCARKMLPPKEFRCGNGRCGKCLVLKDDRLVHSCLVLAASADSTSIRTQRSLLSNSKFKDLESQFESHHIHLCPACYLPRSLAILGYLEDVQEIEEREILEIVSIVACSCTDPRSLIAPIVEELRRSKKVFKRG